MNESKYFVAENLNLEWEDFRLFVSFSCEKGTMTSIVGPSGSGKSSVLRLIAGLEKAKNPAEMKIFLSGKEISKLKPAERGIGMVFQKPSLFTYMRIDDNVSYGLRSLGMKKKESREKAAEFLKKFNLEGFGSRSAEKLSGGEAQRVSLARTLIVRPDLILFDEPPLTRLYEKNSPLKFARCKKNSASQELWSLTTFKKQKP